MRRLTEAGISLEPRNIGGCIDLAFVFVSAEWPRVLGAFLACAVPAGVLTYWAATATEFGWLLALLILAWSSVVLGSLLVTQAAFVAYREPLSVGKLCWVALWQTGLILLAKAVLRVIVIALAPLVVPPLMLLTVAGFQTESRVLEQFRRASHEHRTRDLVKQEFAELFVRMGALALFGSALWLLLTLTVDAGCKLLLDVSPVFGPLGTAAEDPWGYLDPLDILGHVLSAAVSDPQVLTTGVVTGLMTYTLLRLAWFFTFIDLRIRRDCWDLEVAFADEVQRGEAVA